jgi:hypothetical protein
VVRLFFFPLAVPGLTPMRFILILNPPFFSP